MRIHIKNEKEINSMRKGGKILAEVLRETCKIAKPGVSTLELDDFAEALIRERGGIPGFKGYSDFPNTLCLGLNEIIVHGIPRADQILKEGDLLTIDCGVILDDLYTDAARTIAIGEVNEEKQKLLEIGAKTLKAGIKAAQPGVPVNNIGKAMNKIIKSAGFKVIYDLTGHGVGYRLHEAPVVLNYFEKGKSPILKPGMTIAIEPIFSTGSHYMETLEDGWTIVSQDLSPSIQIENTVLITEKGNEILTA